MQSADPKARAAPLLRSFGRQRSARRRGGCYGAVTIFAAVGHTRLPRSVGLRLHCGKRSQVASHAQRARENLAAIGTGDKCTDGVFRMRPRLSSEATAQADLSDARPPDRHCPRADVVFVHGLKVRRVTRRRAQ